MAGLKDVPKLPFSSVQLFYKQGFLFLNCGKIRHFLQNLKKVIDTLKRVDYITNMDAMSFDDFYDDSLDADDYKSPDEFEKTPNDFLDEFDDDIYGDMTDTDEIDDSIESDEIKKVKNDFNFCDIGV